MTDLGTLVGAESYAWDITTSTDRRFVVYAKWASRVLWRRVMTDLALWEALIAKRLASTTQARCRV